MAKIKKICDSNFETEKTVIICGKGKTIEKVKTANKANKLIACINSSTIFVENVDFLFINDIERLESLLDIEENPQKIKNLIVPIQPHKNCGPSDVLYTDCVDRVEKLDINVYTYSLHTQRIKNPETEEIDKIRFGPEIIHSTFHTCLFWLIENGFRNFEIYGVSGQPQYADVYTNMTKKEVGVFGKPPPDHWFKANKEIGIRLLERSKCHYKFF